VISEWIHYSLFGIRSDYHFLMLRPWENRLFSFSESLPMNKKQAKYEGVG
jgi:hypothetical protein